MAEFEGVRFIQEVKYGYLVHITLASMIASALAVILSVISIGMTLDFRVGLGTSSLTNDGEGSSVKTVKSINSANGEAAVSYSSVISELKAEIEELKKSIAHLHQIDITKRDSTDIVEGSSQAEELLNRLSFSELAGLRGPPGKDGRDGRDGKDGKDGTDGDDGKDGRDGRDCADGDNSVSFAQIFEALKSHNEEMLAWMRNEEKDMAKLFNSTVVGLLSKQTASDTSHKNFQDSSGCQSNCRQHSQTDGYLPEITNNIENLTERLNETVTSILSQLGLPNQHGASYTRWGRTICPEVSQLVYEGFVGGQSHLHTGGASNRICLPLAPEWSGYTTSNESGNWIYGAEYQNDWTTASGIFPNSLLDQNVPCASCYSAGRGTSLMIPAKRNCPDDTWTKEYEGYLMTERYNHKASAQYLCVDADPEPIEGLHGNTNGALFYFVQASCDHIGHCPPYIPYAELTCVVCTK